MHVLLSDHENGPKFPEAALSQGSRRPDIPGGGLPGPGSRGHGLAGPARNSSAGQPPPPGPVRAGFSPGFPAQIGGIPPGAFLLRSAGLFGGIRGAVAVAAPNAQISGNLARDLFESRDFGFAELELERIAWLIGNHDVVGNIVSSAERAPRCLTEGLEELSDKEKQTRLNMLIVLSLCDLRGTKNGEFVIDDNATARFWAADLDWLKSKEEDLFGWRNLQSRWNI